MQKQKFGQLRIQYDTGTDTACTRYICLVQQEDQTPGVNMSHKAPQCNAKSKHTRLGYRHQGNGKIFKFESKIATEWAIALYSQPEICPQPILPPLPVSLLSARPGSICQLLCQAERELGRINQNQQLCKSTKRVQPTSLSLFMI